jgi:F420-non-reducing hydrogenase iron-sulfur subunit
MSDTFEPTIIAFFCNWCTYTAADLAGTSRLSYPPNVKIIRVMCSGMVDPKYVIKALLEGADGVLVSGCNPGDCHYINGNFKARRRIKLLKEILPHFGFESERLNLTWIAASDGVLLAETLQELVARIKALGPSQAKLQMAV